MIYSVLSNNKDLISNFLKTFSYHNNKYENLIITVDDKTSNWNDMNNVIKSYSDKIRILRLTDIERYSVQTLGLGNYFTFIKVCPIQAKLLIPFYFKWALGIDKFFMMDDDILVNCDIEKLNFDQCDSAGVDNTALDISKFKHIRDQLNACNELLDKKFGGYITKFPRFVVCAFIMTVYNDYAEYIFRFFNSTKIYEYIRQNSNNFTTKQTNKNILYSFEESCLNVYIISHAKKFMFFDKKMVFHFWDSQQEFNFYNNPNIVLQSKFIHAYRRDQNGNKDFWYNFYFSNTITLTKSKEICPIVYCFDKNYISFAKQSIKSILRYNKDVKIILIVDQYINELKEFEQHIVSEKIKTSKAFKFRAQDRLTLFAYARLLLPEILETYDRVLYLDCDILCTDNINDLLLLTPKLVAGVWDISAKIHCSILKYNKYINSGVLLLNLKELRNQKFTEKALNYNSEAFPKNANWCHDQSIINDLCQADLELIPETYNYQLHSRSYSKQEYEILSKRFKLIHFLGTTNNKLFLSLDVPPHGLNENFADYKSFIKGKRVVLCGSGSTLNDFNPDYFKDAIFVSVNKAFVGLQKMGITSDFCFCQDYSAPTKEYINKIHPSKAFFIGLPYGIPNASWQFKKSDIEKFNAKEYYMSYNVNEFSSDIINKPLCDAAHTIIFSAMQFLLYCEPSEIYLVGCDCTNTKFDNNTSNIKTSLVIDYWKKIKIFANKIYPNIKIYSINPVGLKGLFETYNLSNALYKVLPCYKKQKLDICFVLDQNYVKFMKKCIESLDRFDVDYTIHILSTEKLKDLEWLNYKEYIVDISKYQNKLRFNGKNDRLTAAAYLKLLIPNILKDLDKVLFIDSDILFLKNPTEFFAIDPTFIAGTQTYATEVHQEKPLNCSRYMVSCMMVMNLKNLRDIDFTNRIFEIDQFKIKTEHWQHEETLINYFFKDKITFVPTKYCYANDRTYKIDQNKYSIDDVFILHFPGSNKSKFFEWNIR